MRGRKTRNDSVVRHAKWITTDASYVACEGVTSPFLATPPISPKRVRDRDVLPVPHGSLRIGSDGRSRDEREPPRPSMNLWGDRARWRRLPAGHSPVARA